MKTRLFDKMRAETTRQQTKKGAPDMKHTLLLTAAIAAAMLYANDNKMPQTGCKSEAACKSCCSAKKTYIGKDAAINIALAHAGLERSKVRDLKCELDRENGIMVYEVEFESGQFDYEYDIDAAIGKILKSKKEID
jgi:uncharacterized membrane protein YkoI